MHVSYAIQAMLCPQKLQHDSLSLIWSISMYFIIEHFCMKKSN